MNLIQYLKTHSLPTGLGLASALILAGSGVLAYQWNAAHDAKVHAKAREKKDSLKAKGDKHKHDKEQ
jgi:hypothetical protein